MNCFKLASNLCLGALTLLVVTACGTPKEETGGESSSSSSSGGGTEPTGGAEVTTNPDTTSTSGMSAEGTDTSAGSSSTGPFIPPDETTIEPCPDPENQENNASCTDAGGCGCKSGKCFLVPLLGGFCGECLVDTDCTEGGCTVPNPIAMVGATCNMGEPGAGCMSDDVCSDPVNEQCGVLLNVPGVITVGTCGECDGAADMPNADCPDPALANCTPTYDVEKFSGKYMCVADNSVPQDGGCNLADDGMGAPVGNKACVSGFCGKATVMGVLSLGVCGECNSNSDCPQGQTCSDPVVDLDAAVLVGSVCG